MRRVVVTGTGMVTPVGHSVVQTWESLVAGKSGVREVPGWAELEWQGQKLPVTIAGTVEGFDPAPWLEHKKDERRMDRFILLAMVAAHQAWLQAGLPARLDEEEAERAGVIVGVGLGGISTILAAHDALREKGPRRVSPFFIPMTIANLAPGHMSMRYGLKGPSFVTTSACTSGAHGIGEAFLHIREGRADLMLAGGAEAAVEPLCVAGFASMHALSSSRNARPEAASRPFERARDGFVIGEGAGMVVLEEYGFAKRRGAEILAEVVGYGASSDAYHMTSPAEGGEGAQRAMRRALAMAQLAPGEVGYLNAHATGTPAGDKAEAEAIRAVFGSHATSGLAVSSTKSMTGHLFGAAGAVEAIIALLALRHGVLPPTINLDEPDPECALDHVRNEAREKRVDVVMSNAFGFGGTNGILALRRV